MHEDAIMAELHLLREEYARSLNHDSQAIYQHILRRQQTTTRKLVRFPPRAPRTATPRTGTD
jgi:hypothetical protein